MEGYDVCVFGELAIPAGRSEAWRGLTIDPRVFVDWPDAFANGDAGEGDDELVTVGRWWDDAATFGGGYGRHVDIERGVDRDGCEHWVLRGRFGDAEYEAYRRAIVTSFRLAGAVGGKGTLLLVSDPRTTFPFGYDVTVGPTFSAMRSLDAPALLEAAPLVVGRAAVSAMARA